MAFSRKARKALSAARAGRHAETSYLGLLQAGARARLQGKPITANPYGDGTEESEIWLDGWNDTEE